MNTFRLSILVKGRFSKKQEDEIRDYFFKIGGISRVDAYSISGLIYIEYDRDAITLEKIVSRLKSIGYDVEKLFEEKRKKINFIEDYEKGVLLKLIVSIFLTAITFYSYYIAFGVFSSFILTFFAWFYCGGDFHRKFLENLKNRSFDVNSIISLSITSAFILNTLSTLYPSYFKGISGRWYEVNLMILLFNAGRFLEYSVYGLKSSYTGVLKNFPGFATVIKNNVLKRVNSRDLSPGDIILIKKGEQIPCDCILKSQIACIDECGFTGKSEYVYKKEGELLYAATINLSDEIKAEAKKVYDETLFFRLYSMPANTGEFKEEVYEFMDNITKYLFILLFFINLLLMVFLSKKADVFFLVCSFLYLLSVSVSPIILIVLPFTLLIGSTKAIKLGFVFNNLLVLNKLHKVNLVIFDKTTVSSGIEKLKEIKRSLDRMNIKPVLVTGEKEENVRDILDNLKPFEYYCEVKPHEKHSIVIKYKIMGYNVMVIGDGFNDISAILNAYVSVSVKRITDITSMVSEVVLIRPDLSLVINIINLAKRINITIKRNFIVLSIMTFLFYITFSMSLTGTDYNFLKSLFMYFIIIPLLLVVLNSLVLYFSRVKHK